MGKPSDDPVQLAAAARVRHRLTYNLTPEPRKLWCGGLDGPDIPCAYQDVVEDDETHNAHKGPGDWAGEPNFMDEGATEQDWINFWLKCAIDEAVHEALEHFHVDGKPLIDPHDKLCEHGVFLASAECGDALVRLAGWRNSGSSETA